MWNVLERAVGSAGESPSGDVGGCGYKSGGRTGLSICCGKKSGSARLFCHCHSSCSDQKQNSNYSCAQLRMQARPRVSLHRLDNTTTAVGASAFASASASASTSACVCGVCCGAVTQCGDQSNMGGLVKHGRRVDRI